MKEEKVLDQIIETKSDFKESTNEKCKKHRLIIKLLLFVILLQFGLIVGLISKRDVVKLKKIGSSASSLKENDSNKKQFEDGNENSSDFSESEYDIYTENEYDIYTENVNIKDSINTTREYFVDLNSTIPVQIDVDTDNFNNEFSLGPVEKNYSYSDLITQNYFLNDSNSTIYFLNDSNSTILTNIAYSNQTLETN